MTALRGAAAIRTIIKAWKIRATIPTATPPP